MNALAIFDLDDTLIDTQGLLLRPALETVAGVVGVPVDALNAAGKSIDEVLAPFLDSIPIDKRAAAARAWYDPHVPPLPTLPGARSMLSELQGRIHLALLTRGDPERQGNKIRSCGLAEFFEAIRIRPIEEPGTKRDDIAELMSLFAVPAGRTVVIGDDELDELAHARALGCEAWLVPDVPLTGMAGLLDRRGWLASA